jgi:hypothetical protein
MLAVEEVEQMLLAQRLAAQVAVAVVVEHQLPQALLALPTQVVVVAVVETARQLPLRAAPAAPVS